MIVGYGFQLLLTKDFSTKTPLALLPVELGRHPAERFVSEFHPGGE
jgi:hypothetical protein